mmetsp:Transcript_40513/g.49134  ORF Transcript_40513/g.49134 Transcript_40513/m.49134 type:complete len:343 (-) Transcript_40513:26-1054(-)|eukprot:CAMPEP_0197866618 /NCGR_PEP_ID=MMETSP1438-20131217/44314_1 /TAXON_ID=1461541 /ORGANISM="Pterosperma sp., Strain CCMP1384" /LENGTH=342 /DNA_ID=CAMNT_0043485203 /DNA_START=298 /DNA_END=1326 /DNA_ORIENTATION=-
MQDASGQPTGEDQAASTGQDYNQWVASFHHAYSKNQFQGAQYYAAPGQMPGPYANMWGGQGQYAASNAYFPAYAGGQAYAPYHISGAQPADPAAYARSLQQGQAKHVNGEQASAEGQQDGKAQDRTGVVANGQVADANAGSDGGSVSEAPQASVMPPAGAVQPAAYWRPAGPGAGHVVDYSTAVAAGLVDEREAKRQKRKQSNRESARRSRMRKQAECEELGKRVQALTNENLELRKNLTELHKTVTDLQSSNKGLRQQVVESGAEAPPEPELPKLTLDPNNLPALPAPVVISAADDDDDDDKDDGDDNADDNVDEKKDTDEAPSTSEKAAEKAANEEGGEA